MTDTRRIDDLFRFLNATSQSGYVNVGLVIAELAKLLDLPVEATFTEQKGR